MTWPGLGVVVVLHGTAAADSAALRSLSNHLGDHDRVSVVVQDNTAVPAPDRSMPSVVEVVVSRPDNPGLADAYRAAALLFSDRGVEWMALLDQDTSVTRDYLDEVIAVASGEVAIPPAVAVLVPRLMDSGRQVSPHGHVRLRARPVSSAPGVVHGFATHLNSGSVLRLSALRRVGGLPDGYPLDYLDHAVAQRLRDAGGLTWLLRSSLEHRLSLLDRRTLSAGRLASILDAEHRYHREFGSRADVAWLAVRTLLGAALSTTRLRPSPDAGLERRAALRAARAVLTGRDRTAGTVPDDAGH